MSILDSAKDLFGSTEQASAGHSANELETTASNLPYGWFDDYKVAKAGQYSHIRLERAEHPEFTGSDKVHKVQFVKCKVSQDKLFVTWFFPELSTINVEHPSGDHDRIVTLTTSGAMPSNGKGALRKALACLQGLRHIEADDEILYPKLYTYIESETGLSMSDLSDISKFDPSRRDGRRPYRIPGLILNIIEQTSNELLLWFQNKEFKLTELSGVDLQCKLTCSNGKTFIMSKSGTKSKPRVAKPINEVDSLVKVSEEDDF